MIRILRHLRQLNPWQKFCLEEWLLIFCALAFITVSACATIDCVFDARCSDWLLNIFDPSFRR